MALPVPDLDDRRFQDLVDDAKRLVQQRCPEWTDHNVSDPGVTLIELFAWMTEQVVYRLNRVPDRLHTTFLDLLGVSTFPATAARVPQTFWLSAPQPATVVVPGGTRVSTPRPPGGDPVVFTTVADLELPAVALQHVRTVDAEGAGRDVRAALLRGDGVPCFTTAPQEGDALLLGLSAPAGGCAVAVTMDCSTSGVGVDPEDPPLAWEAWTGDGWTACELERDGTGGFNKPGDVLVHVPPGHHTSSFGRSRAAWLRVRVVEARPDQPTYSASPVLHSAQAAVLGGTVTAVHADRVVGETVGTSEGVAGQRFALQHAPVVPGEVPVVVEVAEPQPGGETAWTSWHVVADFGDSGPEDRHVVLEQRSGELVFGPVVREPDGGVRQLGRVPQAGAVVRVREYRTGGGAHGNVGSGTLVVLTSSLPYVSEVVNRRAAAGGRDAEDVEEAKARGPVVLRHRGRAVTAEDFEHLAQAAAPEVARVRAVPAGDGAAAGAVRVLVVPAVPGSGRLAFGHLVPDPLTLQRIADALDGVRLLTTRIVVEPPSYQGVTVVTRVRASSRSQPREVEAAVHAALERWFSPVVGGPDGTGWPFGRTVHVGEVYGVLQAVDGVDLVEDTRLYAADPVSGARGEAAQRIELDPNALVFSFEHQVRVLAPGAAA